MERAYRLVTGLLYPGSLGAALVWFAQALWLRLYDSQKHPFTWWSLWFGLWFLIAYASWFARLTDDRMKAIYDARHLASDLIDSIFMFIAFGVLGLMLPDIPEMRKWVFFCSVAVSASGLVAEKKRHIAVWIGLTVSILAFVCYFVVPDNRLYLVDWTGLIVLSVLLIWYETRVVDWG